MKCKNCEKLFEGKFCNYCGQSSRVKRIDLKYLLDEVPESIFQINHGFLFTVKELFIRPGHNIRQYIDGKRKHYSRPIAFILLASAIYVITTYLMGGVTFMDDFVAGLSLGRNDTAPATELRIYNWISSNQAYAILILLPFYSFSSYLAYIKSKYNYTENLVLNIYITGQQLIIYTAFSFITIKEDYLVWITLITGMYFNFWTLNQFFENQKILTKVARILLFYFYLLLQIILILLITALTWKVFNDA